MRWKRAGIAAAGVSLLAILAAELAFRLAASMPSAPLPGASCAVLVLGYPAQRDGSPGPVLRARVTTGVAAQRRLGCEKLVLSGGAAHNAFVEADVMAHVAEELGAPREQIVLERAATSTWENVAFSLPLLEGADTVLVASDALHARRGVRYLCRLRPAQCPHVFPASTYVPFQLFWWKPPAALYELRKWLWDRAT
jgi:uncharacterized SAM-binding protein YcdF (DUF218 family)